MRETPKIMVTEEEANLIHLMADPGRTAIATAVERLRSAVERPLPQDKWGDQAMHIRSIAYAVWRSAPPDAPPDENYRAAVRRIANRIYADALSLGEAVQLVAAELRRGKDPGVMAAYSLYVASRSWAQDQQLPDLEGSPKQLLHAEPSRRHVMMCCGPNAATHCPGAQPVVDRLRNERRARWWIDFGGLFSFAAQRPFSPAIQRLIAGGQLLNATGIADLQKMIDAADHKCEQAESAAATTESKAQLRAVERKYELRSLSATSPAQRLYARQLRARTVLEGRDVEAMKSLRSAPQIIDRVKGRQRSSS